MTPCCKKEVSTLPRVEQHDEYTVSYCSDLVNIYFRCEREEQYVFVRNTQFDSRERGIL